MIYNGHLQNKQLCSCSYNHRAPMHINTTATRVKPAAFNAANGSPMLFFPLLPLVTLHKPYAVINASIMQHEKTLFSFLLVPRTVRTASAVAE